MRTVLKVLLYGVVGLFVVIPAMLLLAMIGVPLVGVVMGLVGAGVGLLFLVLKVGLVVILPILVIVFLAKLVFGRA